MNPSLLRAIFGALILSPLLLLTQNCSNGFNVASSAGSGTLTSTNGADENEIRLPVNPDSATTTTIPNAPVAGSNSVDVMINDMKLKNDGLLANINGVFKDNGWAARGALIMGNCPRGTCAPTYWESTKTQYMSSASWNVTLPWFVVFNGVGNSATNTRIELRNMKVYIKNKAGIWKLIGHDANNLSAEIYDFRLVDKIGDPSIRREATGNNSIKPVDYGVLHGWWSEGRKEINGTDVRAYFITLQARLVMDDPARADDRNMAKYLIHVGGDYYPNMTTSTSKDSPNYLGAPYYPGIGVSRAKLITKDWNSFNMITIETAPREQLWDGSNSGIPESELRSNPPPL